MRDMDRLQQEVAEWAQEAFGEPDMRTLDKLREELEELDREFGKTGVSFQSKQVRVANECADMIILLCQLATQYEFSLMAATNVKLRHNMIRTWERNETGTYDGSDHD